TNAHVVLAEAPEAPKRPAASPRSHEILVLSAPSEAALPELAERFARHIEAEPDDALPDICFTASTGRSSFAHRLAVTADRASSLSEKLRAKVRESSSRAPQRGASTSKIAFLFAGQGSHYLGMGQALYAHNGAFRTILDRCDAWLRPHLPESLLAVLFEK